MNVLAIMTCFNRKDKTVTAIDTLSHGNPGTNITFIAVDDGSTDGTGLKLEELKNSGTSIEIINGDGNLFYSGGMRKGISKAKQMLTPIENNRYPYDAVLLFNDDVMFFEGCLDNILKNPLDRIYVGPTCDDKGNLTYGGARYSKAPMSIRCDYIGPDDPDRLCDTFNANCVIIPSDIFYHMDNIDSKYTHGIGDFDLGLSLSKKGVKIEVVDSYCGICHKNPVKGTYHDTSLPRLERLKKKESPKGLPSKLWFYYLNKNFGPAYAIFYSITPFIKLLLGK